MTNEADQALEAMLRLGTPTEVVTKRRGIGKHMVYEKVSGALIATATKQHRAAKQRKREGPNGGRWDIEGVGILATRRTYDTGMKEWLTPQPNNSRRKKFGKVIGVVEKWLTYVIDGDQVWSMASPRQSAPEAARHAQSGRRRHGTRRHADLLHRVIRSPARRKRSR